MTRQRSDEVCAAQAVAQIAGVCVTAEGRGPALSVRRLKRQLDSFGDCNLFMGRCVMLGRDQRRRGGAPRPSQFVLRRHSQAPIKRTGVISIIEVVPGIDY